MSNVDDSRFYVYVHRRLTDSKVFYVGKGSGYRYKRTNRNAYWKNVVSKHGYFHEIVLSNLTESQAILNEIELIKFYGKENLVNLTDGGEGMSGLTQSPKLRAKLLKVHTGAKRDLETCRRISESLKGRILSEETRLKISQKLEGVKLSEATKLKMVTTRTGRKHTRDWNDNIAKAWSCTPKRYAERCKAMSNAKATRQVVCMETQVTYNSLKLAVMWLKSLGYVKASHSKISNVCSGKRLSAYGYSWKYV
jgi:hypothetical protein